MDGKFLARTGAAVFVGIAVAMTLVRLREEPPPPVEPRQEVWVHRTLF
jgi:heme exporter protein D